MKSVKAVVAFGLAAVLGAAALPTDEPLIDAARNGDAEAVRSLLAEGADANTAQGDGDDRAALGRGARPTPRSRICSWPRAPLWRPRPGSAAIRRCTWPAVAGTARSRVHSSMRAPIPRATTTGSGVTPLHLAAAAVDGADAVTALLRRGAVVDAREGSSGQTPLMFAAAYGRTEAVVALLEYGADPATRTETIDVLRSLAVDREASLRLSEAIAESRKAEAEGRSWEPTPQQAQAAIMAQRDFVLSGYDPGDVDGESLGRVRADYPGGPEVIRPPYREVLVGKTGGMSALLHTAREGHVESALALLYGGADIDQVSADNTSPLLMAMLNGQFDLAMALVERGADPNLAASTDGATPLFAALQTHWAPKSQLSAAPRARRSAGGVPGRHEGAPGGRCRSRTCV